VSELGLPGGTGPVKKRRELLDASQAAAPAFQAQSRARNEVGARTVVWDQGQGLGVSHASEPGFSCLLLNSSWTPARCLPD